MTITWVQFAWAVALLLGWIGSLFGVIWFLTRQLAAMFKKGIDENTAGLRANDEALKTLIDTAQADYKRLDDEFKAFLANLPLQYYRREDAIREFTAISSKLDRLHEIISERMLPHAR